MTLRMAMALALTLAAVVLAAYLLVTAIYSSATPAAGEHTRADLAVPAQDVSDLVHARSMQIAREERHACAEVESSSNAHDYVVCCPTYQKLVALGTAALPEIAHFILGHRARGLDGYLLVIAGDTMWARKQAQSANGVKSRATSTQWARQYLAWAKQRCSRQF